MTFKELGIAEPILRAIEEKGYTVPTPIQEKSIPILLNRKDLLGCAQTGTGKTAAFSIPIIQHLFLDPKQSSGHRVIRALVVTPTRELAIQVEESFAVYGKYTGLRSAVIFGGVKQNPQVDKLEKGVDILVATPGRLLDLIKQGFISLKHIEFSVLDEADRMLDMGFIHDIKKIIALLPAQRQSLFFSATMPPDIVELSKKILGNPMKVSVTPEQTTAEKVTQQLYFVGKGAKAKLLVHLLEGNDIRSAIVFSRTKHGANKIVKILEKAEIKAEAIHGNKSQAARQRALSNFTEGSIKVLIATDIAARGIDISELSHVINYDLPNIPETYVHRIGRTGRASASGAAISFCDDEERPYLKDIQKLIGQTIPVVQGHAFSADIDGAEQDEEREFGRSQQNRGARGQNARSGESPRGGRNQRGGSGDNPRGQRKSDSASSDDKVASPERPSRPSTPRQQPAGQNTPRPQGSRPRNEGGRTDANRDANKEGERRGNGGGRGNSNGGRSRPDSARNDDNRGNREDNRGNREDTRGGRERSETVKDGNRHDNRNSGSRKNSGTSEPDGNRYTNDTSERRPVVNGNTRNRSNDRQDTGNRKDQRGTSSDSSAEKPAGTKKIWDIFKWKKS